MRHRRDDLPVDITIWSAADNSALIFRNGLLIGTPGLPGNLISADVPVRENTAGPAQGGMRRYELRAGNSEGRDPDGSKTAVINDSQAQTVWKSRQWAVPETGYLRIRNLSN